MPYVDEKLLARLVDKYGLERQTTNIAKSTLWGKVTKEYNKVHLAAISNQFRTFLGAKYKFYPELSRGEICVAYLKAPLRMV